VNQSRLLLVARLRTRRLARALSCAVVEASTVLVVVPRLYAAGAAARCGTRSTYRRVRHRMAQLCATYLAAHWYVITIAGCLPPYDRRCVVSRVPGRGRLVII